jgi:hypothetical protein
MELRSVAIHPTLYADRRTKRPSVFIRYEKVGEKVSYLPADSRKAQKHGKVCKTLSILDALLNAHRGYTLNFTNLRQPSNWPVLRGLGIELPGLNVNGLEDEDSLSFREQGV